MLSEARKHVENRTTDCGSLIEIKDVLDNKTGFVRAMWCGDKACEEKIKEDTGASSRCIPFDQERIAETCVSCGKPAKELVYWGRAY